METESIEVKRHRLREPQRIAASPHGMVATAHEAATQAGCEMLEEGGNAMDAAVAAAFALGVCEPAASGLGGQTMMMIRDGKTRRTFALDGSSRAPNRVTVETLSPTEARRGHRGTTVPSTPAVLDYALRRYGSLPLARVLEPAIRLAREGCRVTELQHSLTVRERRHLRRSTAAPFFLHKGERPYPEGALFQQPVLAATLERIAKRGVKDFYTGRIARLIHEDMARNDGLLRKDDLAQIPRPIERRPLTCNFRGARIFTFPPPGAGRTVVEVLHILEHLPARLHKPDKPRGALALAAAIRQASIDRQDRPFDPNYYPQVKRRRMMSPDYAQKIAREVQASLKPAAKSPIKTHGETTHLSVMDGKGGIVGLTQSIEKVYGSCAVTPELGFLYNNYLTAFEYEDISHPYYLRPNAVPWASVAPSIAFRGHKPWLVIGSPGSDRITSAIVQVLLRLRKQSPLDAVTAPRLHCSTEGKVSLEAGRFRDDVVERLRSRGYAIDEREPFSFYLGCVQLVLQEEGEFIGVADPRRDGSARGPR